MSDATLLSWRVGHGLALETRSGLFEVLAQRDGSTLRLVNSCPVDHCAPGIPGNFEYGSRTAQRLDQLFTKYEAKLRELNELSLETDPAVYRSQWWALKTELKGE
jgi:hypothetical protein